MTKIIKQLLLISATLVICATTLFAQTISASSIKVEVRNIRAKYPSSEQVMPMLVNTSSQSIFLVDGESQGVMESSQITTYNNAYKSWKPIKRDGLSLLRCGNEIQTYKEIKPGQSHVFRSLNNSLFYDLNYRKLNKAVYKFSITYLYSLPKSLLETVPFATAESIPFTFKHEVKTAKK